ncbi:protein Skeletor, isoforms B/C [Galendromus occidentalis]|uniref:Protein Skeletor, isoforms B/C n=1 Tax=Galendromus occidentalis TaxID=34638 RepID=A0AAJ6QMB2_9ACAR|nr:protein Skeletor, isoforms B/C [Galendromus occidentalis]
MGPRKSFLICALIVILSVAEIWAAVEKHQGLYIGRINTYSHQVTGSVYAVDEYTLLIKGFFYDGLGQDAFFWAGSSIRPSNVGFIVPDEEGKTNVLEPYTDKDIYIRLPDKRKITSIKWLAIWNLRDNDNYGDIYLPDGFEPPAPRKLSELTRQGGGVKSGTVVIMDTKTILLPHFHFSGDNNDTYFWVGQGAQPSSAGYKIPDEQGYLNPIRTYRGDTITLVLPGKTTVFDIDWFSVWNANLSINYGSVQIPHGEDIPPSTLEFYRHESRLQNCEQLHSNLQLRWEIQGSSMTFELTGPIADDHYFALGPSGDENSTHTQMLNADVAVAFVDGPYGQVIDYKIGGIFPCSKVLSSYQGVCPDTVVGGVNSYQILTFSKKDGMTTIIYRRDVLPIDDAGDRVFDLSNPTAIAWAIGRLNHKKEPLFHHIYPRGDVFVHFGSKTKVDTCVDFIKGWPPQRSNEPPWGPFKIVGNTVTQFIARVGPAGGSRGYSGITGLPSPGVSWYINGLLVPTLYLKRGRTYTFRVEGGDNPHNGRYYHPLYITDSPYGGFAQMTEAEQKDSKIYAGVIFNRQGKPQATAVGRLCAWVYNSTEPRQADGFPTFPKYRNQLRLDCDDRATATLQWTPNTSTPDVVYYQSYTTSNMGGKIYLLDEFSAGSS